MISITPLHDDWSIVRKKNVYFFIIIYILFLVSMLGSAALKADPCPPTINDPGWTSAISYFEPGPSDTWGSVQYKTRYFGGKQEIQVDWTTLQNYGRYGLTNDELKQMMIKAIIVDIAGRHCEHLIGQQQYVFYEVTTCRESRHCYLHLKLNNEVFCQDEGWPGPDPVFFTYQGEHFYKCSNYVTCGTQCCENIYTVECAQNPVGGGNYAHILSITKSPYPGSSCSGSLDTDCLTGAPEPCESTCN